MSFPLEVVAYLPLRRSPNLIKHRGRPTSGREEPTASHAPTVQEEISQQLSGLNVFQIDNVFICGQVPKLVDRVLIKPL